MIKAGRIGSSEANKTALSAVKRFSNGKDFSFEELDYKWLKDFETYHYSRGNTANSLGVYLRSIRMVYNTAIKRNIVKESLYPFGRNKYTIPSGPVHKRAITKEDIIKIESLELKKGSYLWHAKNYFLFSFYTMGMNWIDMAYLKMKNITNGRIEYIRSKTKRKTAKAFSIKINDKIDGILSHYINGKDQEQHIFPIILRTESPALIREDAKNRLKKYNQNLERIRKLCGIEQKLTSYVSRHSWATIAKRSGINVGIISDALGHHDPYITQTYLDSFGNDEIDKANEMLLG
jgi:integrase